MKNDITDSRKITKILCQQNISHNVNIGIHFHTIVGLNHCDRSQSELSDEVLKKNRDWGYYENRVNMIREILPFLS